MRVLHVSPSFYPAFFYGGPIFSVLNLCQHLNQFGCEVRVLTTDANGPTRLSTQEQQDPSLNGLNVKFCRRVGKGMIAPDLIANLARDSAWADVIHLTGVYNFTTFPTFLAARRSGKPLVCSPRGTLQRWTGSRRVGAKSVWESFCRFMAPSKLALHVTSDQEASESRHRLGESLVAVIPNGVDIPVTAPAFPSVESFNLLFIGRLDPKKGVELLLAATNLLDGLGVKNWQLLIAGSGESSYVDHLRSLAKTNPQPAKIQFCGQISGEAKRQAFARSHTVVVPSFTENFGMVVAEALAHARPVIASRGTPWAEMEQHQCGFWVPNDSPSLASAIANLATRDCSAMGSRGREWMQSQFSGQERARQMISLYRELIDNQSSC